MPISEKRGKVIIVEAIIEEKEENNNLGDVTFRLMLDLIPKMAKKEPLRNGIMFFTNLLFKV